MTDFEKLRDHIDAKLTPIAADTAEVKTDIAVMKVDVAYHIRRTDLLESSVKILHDEAERRRGMWKLVLRVGVVLTIIATFIGLLNA